MKILLLEDDYAYRISISEYLRDLNYEVDEASDGNEACDKILKNSYHLIILDIKVPEISGFEVLKYIRTINQLRPVMMMTSLTDIDDLSKAYELGCNEYLKKPFHLAELKFRISEIMKTYYDADENTIIKIANKFFYNFALKTLKKDGVEILLSAKEMKIIDFLLSNVKKFTSIDDIINNVWDGYGNSVDVRVHIKNLRAKTSNDFILSSRGLGYKINV